MVPKLRSSLRAILLYSLVAFLGTMAFRMSMPAIAFYARSSLEASALGVGLLTAAFFAARAFSSIVAGGFYDKGFITPKTIASVCFALNAITVYMYSLAYSITALTLLRFIQGVLNGFGWVTIQAMLGDSVDKSVRGRVYSIYFSSGSLGIATGNALYASISSLSLEYILSLSSLLFALTTLIIALACPWSATEARARRPSRGAGGSSLACKAAIALLLIVFGVAMYSSYARGDLLYIVFREVYGVSRARVALTVSVATAASIVTGYMLSWVSDKFSDEASLKTSASIALAGAFLISLKNLYAALLGLALFYSGASGVVPVARRVAMTRYRLGGTVLGLVNASGNAGAIIGSLVMGFVYRVMDGERTCLGPLEIIYSEAIMVIPLIIALASSFILSLKRSS